MVSLLLVVLLLQIAIFLINALGAKTINEVLWRISSRFPLPASKDAQETLQLKKKVLDLKRQMNAISAQDNFAQWAKLRREHDKALARYDELTAKVSAYRNQFDTVANGLRWLGTNGMQTALQFWHAKTPIFTYPQGWLPWPVEWILGFPRAPYGAVSINVWAVVCGTIVTLVGNAVLGLLDPNAQKTDKQKIPVVVERGKKTEKKEL